VKSSWSGGLAFGLMLAAIGCVYAVQRYLSGALIPVPPVWTFGTWIIALILLWISLRLTLLNSRTIVAHADTWALGASHHWHVLLIMVAVGGSLLATIYGQSSTHARLALGAWIIALLATLTVAGNLLGARRWLRLNFREHRLELLLVSLCVIAAFLLRSIGLASVPGVVAGDEGNMGIDARRFLYGEDPRVFVTGWFAHPRLTFVAMALTMRIWGDDIQGLRMQAAIIGTLTLLPMYVLARALGGRTLALAAVWLLATLPLHLHFSRLGLNNIWDGLIISLAFAGVVHAERTGRVAGWIWVGFAVALSLYFYPGSRGVVVLLAAYGGLQLWRTYGRWLRWQAPGLLVGIGAFLIVGAPMVRFAFEHWTEFNARVAGVNIFQSGWLTREVESTGRSMPAILGTQLARGLLSVVYYRDTSGFYADRGPMLQFWSAIMFVVGLGVSMLRRRRIHLLVLVWFFGLGILGGGLTETVPSYARLSGLAPALAIVIAIGVVTLVSVARRAGLVPRRLARPAVGMAVLVLGIYGVRFYFVDYTARADYGGQGAELMTQVGEAIRERPPGFRIYFMGLPRMFHDFPTRVFLAPRVEGTDLPLPEGGRRAEFSPENDLGTEPALFFAIPEREAELRDLAVRLPGGTWIEGKRHIDGSPLWFGYDVPAAEDR
jgi:hypothetical protein